MTYNQYGLSVVTEPAIEPLTLTETKEFLRVEDSNSDNFINNLILVARQAAEQFLKKALITQTLKITYDQYAPCQIELPMQPVQSVDNVDIISQDLSITNFNSTAYYLSAGNKYLIFEAVPIGDFIEITYQAGYGDNITDVPEAIRQAMLMHIAKMYDNRTGTVTMPIAAKHLYIPYRKIDL